MKILKGCTPFVVIRMHKPYKSLPRHLEFTNLKWRLTRSHIKKKKAIAIYRAFSSNAHIKNWKNNFYTTKHKFCFYNSQMRNYRTFNVWFSIIYISKVYNMYYSFDVVVLGTSVPQLCFHQGGCGWKWGKISSH